MERELASVEAVLALQQVLIELVGNDRFIGEALCVTRATLRSRTWTLLSPDEVLVGARARTTASSASWSSFSLLNVLLYFPWALHRNEVLSLHT